MAGARPGSFFGRGWMLLGIFLILGMLIVAFVWDILSEDYAIPGPLWGLAGIALTGLLSATLVSSVMEKFAESVVKASAEKVINKNGPKDGT